MLGILSFMQQEESTYGSIRATSAERKRLAQESEAFNKKNLVYLKNFTQDIILKIKDAIKKDAEKLSKIKEEKKREVELGQSVVSPDLQLSFFRAGKGPKKLPLTL